MLGIVWFIPHPWPPQSTAVQVFTAIPCKSWCCVCSAPWALLCHCKHLGRGQGWLWALLSQQAGTGNMIDFSFFVWNHCRTLEYLIKHLTHLASFSNMTNMHTRNLALVWAPNLLRYSRDFLSSRAPYWTPRGVAASEPEDPSPEGNAKTGKSCTTKGKSITEQTAFLPGWIILGFTASVQGSLWVCVFLIKNKLLFASWA